MCPELDNSIVLLTDEVLPASSLLTETLGSMVVDSGCISTVCGSVWLKSYLESLSHKDQKSVTTTLGSGNFRFGNGASFRSTKLVTLPVYLGKKRIHIMTDVVDCEIPLLFSKSSLKKGEGSLNFQNDSITVLGETLKTTTTGHYYLKLSRDTEAPVEMVST